MSIIDGKGASAPAEEQEDVILCIDDLKKSAIKKLPHGIKGMTLPKFSYELSEERRQLRKVVDI